MDAQELADEQRLIYVSSVQTLDRERESGNVIFFFYTAKDFSYRYVTLAIYFTSSLYFTLS